MTQTVTIKPPIDEVIKQLLDDIQGPEVRRRILILASAEVKDRAAAYPAEGPWNYSPGSRGNNRWYQRQFGPRWMRKDGIIGGKNTSQKLQKSWRIEANENGASVFTGVTYAPYLLDADRQVSWADAHGWKTTEQIAEDYQERFIEIILQEIDKSLD